MKKDVVNTFQWHQDCIEDILSFFLKKKKWYDMHFENKYVWNDPCYKVTTVTEILQRPSLFAVTCTANFRVLQQVFQ